MGFSLQCSVPPGQGYSFVNRMVHDTLNTRDHERIGSALKIPEPWPAGHPCSLKYHPIPSFGFGGWPGPSGHGMVLGLYNLNLYPTACDDLWWSIYIISCSTSGGYFFNHMTSFTWALSLFHSIFIKLNITNTEKNKSGSLLRLTLHVSNQNHT
jgi:hypothetical protein